MDGVYANSNYTEIKYAFIYDNNGNVKTDSQRTFDYTGFNKPYAITSNDGSVSMKYGVDRQLYYKESTLIENGKSTTYKQVYVGNYEKSVRSGGEGALTEHKYHLGNIVITQRTGETEVNYLHKDHQGSVIAVTDSTGHVVTQSIYDPFGKKTDVYLANKYATFVVSKVTERGYTGHKHLSHVDIIHMNGRIYDPTLGRFLQADPFVQFPSNSQSYNRYSYVLNNPMSYTDPSGYFSFNPFKKIGRSLIKGATKIFGAQLVNLVGTAVSTYFGGAFGAAAWTYEFNRAMGISSSGALRAAAISYVATSLPAANTGSAIGNFLVDGAVGGSISYASGGNFGHGFWAAGFNSAVGGSTMTNNAFANVVISGAIGGTISKVTGGKFANGATSAAFSATLRQDWSSSEALVEGSPEWEAREEAYFQAELAADQAMLASGDLLALNLPSLPQGLVDFSAGFGDVVSFGATGYIRDWMGTNSAVNFDSDYYTAGQVSGVVHSTVFGGAAGLRAAGSAGRGLEFSHWIPNRMGGPRSLWNGNFVSREFHALSDPFRYRFMPRSWKALNPMPSRVSQQWDRIPYVYKGGVAGLGYGTSSAGTN